MKARLQAACQLRTPDGRLPVVPVSGRLTVSPSHPALTPHHVFVAPNPEPRSGTIVAIQSASMMCNVQLSVCVCRADGLRVG